MSQMERLEADVRWITTRLGVRRDLLARAAARLPDGDVLREAIELELESEELYDATRDAVYAKLTTRAELARRRAVASS